VQHPTSFSLTDCLHCGRKLSRSGQKQFCCRGCETVYSLAKHSMNKISDSTSTESPPTVKRFYIEGIRCQSCVWQLERLSLECTKEVASATFNLSQSVLSVGLRPQGDLAVVLKQIRDWGYIPHLIEGEEEARSTKLKTERTQLIEVGVAGALSGNIMLMTIPLYMGVSGGLRTLFEWLSFGLAVPALLYSGRSFFKKVYAGIRSRTFPIDAPILAAILVAFFYSSVSLLLGTHELYFDSLSALIFLLLASRYYLDRLRSHSEMSLGLLEFFQAKNDVKVGQVLSPVLSERIGYDAIVRQGGIYADSSHLTGESLPMWIGVGSTIYSGTEVIETLPDTKIEAHSVGENTRIAKLIKEVKLAQDARTTTELASDQWAKNLLKFISVLAGLAMLYFIFTGQSTEGAKRVLALLIVTCPCALALATPLVFAMSMKALLRDGVLVKDPAAIDGASQVSTIFFDKTGTLTEGKLALRDKEFSISQEEAQALYSMVTRSRHPVSRALEGALIHKYGNLVPRNLEKFKEIPGLGLEATVECENSLASFSLVRSSSQASDESEVQFYRTTVTGDRALIATFQFLDQVRRDSKAVIQALYDHGYQVGLLSGDRLSVARKIAQEVGILNVHAPLTPEEKAEYASSQMMVGDGWNDALALSKAKISFAVQGGMDAAVQSAQAIALRPGISSVLTLIRQSSLARKTLKQNFFFSTVYNLVGATLSLLGFMNPLVAAILMPISASTVFLATVIRLKKRRDP